MVLLWFWTSSIESIQTRAWCACAVMGYSFHEIRLFLGETEVMDVHSSFRTLSLLLNSISLVKKLTYSASIQLLSSPQFRFLLVI